MRETQNSKKKIKIKFTDFSYDSIKNITIPILEKYFEVEESDNPDYVFYSVEGYDHLKYDCVRIFWTGENLQPDFNICDYAIGFGNISFEDRYLRAPLFLFYSEWRMACEKHLHVADVDASKKKFCNFVYSNGKGDCAREQFFKMLSEYKRVDSGGRFMNNIGGPVDDKVSFQKDYKFSIAFENSSTNGYTTEKILHAFAAGTIPIYWGNPTVANDFNPKAFINCHDYSSFDEVIELIKRIDSDDALYRQYISQPMCLDTNLVDNPLCQYEQFLVDIFSRDLDKAYRRNRILWGSFYEQRMKKLFLKYDAIKKLVSKIKRK